MSKQVVLLVFALGFLLFTLFARSFDPDQTLFSNDGPLAAASAIAAQLPEAFFGAWADLQWIGFEQISSSANITAILSWIFGPLYFSKFYTPISLFFLGVCAWAYFRELKFQPVVCLLGALAATLNMNVFSNACWGLASRALVLGSAFLALKAIHSGMVRRPLVKGALAGLAVGMAVMEGYDVGAMFSVFVALFAFFVVYFQGTGTAPVRAAKGFGLVALLAVCAAFISAYTLDVLINTQIKGIAGTKQDTQSKEERYEYATQWSLPKAEALRVIIPGLWGYRMNDEFGLPYAGAYWGTVGQSPDYDKRPGLPRHSGSGEYAGVLVVMMAFWAFFQSLRGKQSPYTEWERKCIWFWSALALVTLVLAFGRHTPLYRIVYNVVPYFSTVRNPIKFMHPFHLTMLILFAYGMQDLVVRYLVKAKESPLSLADQIRMWWDKVQGFDKRWVLGSCGVIAVSLLGWLLLASLQKDIVAYLKKNGYPDNPQFPKLAEAIGQFSMLEYGWYVAFLVLSVLFVTCILSGGFAGRRARLAGFMLGMLIVVDLARADAFWIVYEPYKVKLASNAIVDVLREKAHEHRVSAPRFQFPPELMFFHEFHHMEWLQHHFQYYNIQSLDVAQMRSPPEDMVNFEKALQSNPLRRWQLTNTRYLLSIAPYVEQLNIQLDPIQRRFRAHTYFTLYQETNGSPIKAQTNATGPFCLIEFSGALPRAQLYSNWIVNPNGEQLLAQLVSTNFDPAQTVLVGSTVPAPAPAAGTNAAAPRVDFTSYAPKHIKLSADAATPTILLLNDKYTDHWRVWVDGKEETLLRCNYVMRGVYLPAGKHAVEFHYLPPITSFYVSLAAIGMGILLSGFLLFETWRGAGAKVEPEPPSAKPAAASKSPKQ
jgi:hypothetical protein